MKNYELVTIINPNLSSKVDAIKSDLEKLLSDNSFNIVKTEDIGRRQLAYTINNHHKGHYLIYSLEGNPAGLSEIESKLKYNESIIRYTVLKVFSHSDADSALFVESKTKKKQQADNPAEENKSKEVKESAEIAKDTSRKGEENE